MPEDYETLDADKKLQLLYEKCAASAGPGKYVSPLDLLKMLWRDPNPTFDHVSDEKIAPMYTGLKPIHSTGPVVAARFDAVKDTPYTGDFQGNPNVIMRFSLAKAPEGEATVPGVGIKFLHDKIPSSNFVAMFGLEGQDTIGVFDNIFRNHVAPGKTTATKLLEWKFQQASKIVSHVGLSDIASHKNDGTSVETINFPYQVRLVPNPKVQELGYGIDELENIPEGTKLYDVQAQSDPSAEWTAIGSFTTTASFVTSQWGDENLFFLHERFENDLKLRPDWGESMKSGESKCPFDG